MPDQIVENFLSAAHEKLKRLSDCAMTFETGGADIGMLNEMFTLVHTLKGEAAVLGLKPTKALAHGFESLLSGLRLRQLKADKAVIDAVWTGVELLRRRLEQFESGSNGTKLDEEQARYALVLGKIIEEGMKTPVPGADNGFKYFYQGCDVSVEICAVKDLLEKCARPDTVPQGAAGMFLEAFEALKKNFGTDPERLFLLDSAASEIDELASDDGGVDKFLLDKVEVAFQKILVGVERKVASAAKAESQTAAGPNETAAQTAASYRIQEERLNEIIRVVSLLDKIKEAFEAVGVKFEGLNIPEELVFDFEDALNNLRLLSNSIWSMLLKTKVTSPKLLFDKIEKMIQVLATSCGKKVVLDCRGKDLAVDRGRIELLESILVHVVRNAVDHGIETAQDRQNAGKAAEGRIVVEVVQGPQELKIAVADDGRGIDFAAVRMEAFKKAQISPEEVNSLSDERTAELIFLPGLTTSRTVSEISGRGMGLSAVLGEIKKSGGNIRVVSKKGQGARFEIVLPVKDTLSREK